MRLYLVKLVGSSMSLQLFVLIYLLLHVCPPFNDPNKRPDVLQMWIEVMASASSMKPSSNWLELIM